MASPTFASPTRNIDPPDLIALAAVAALATAKAWLHLRQTVLAPAPAVSDRETAVASPADPVPFDEDLMDRFLTGPNDVHEPEAGLLRRLQARRRAGAEAQWRSLSQ